MMARWQPYPDMKPSGAAWLGDIPTHWEITSLGSITNRRSERNRPDLPLLSVLREKGVVPRSSLSQEENHNYIPDDRSNYLVVKAGDLVVNKMKAWQGSVGIAPIDGIVSPAYFVFFLKKITKNFAHCLLRSRLYADFFSSASDGVRVGQWDLNTDRMKRIPVPIPSPEEQETIAAWLRAQDARIARFVQGRRALAKLLAEQKTALISHAVTRGAPNSGQPQGGAPTVNCAGVGAGPSACPLPRVYSCTDSGRPQGAAPTKPSGVPWLGDVPEHWEVKPLKRWVEINKHTLREDTDPDFSFRYVDIGSVTTGRLSDSLESFRFVDAPSRARRILHRGDTIISTVRTYLKAVWYAGKECEGLIASTGFAVLTPGEGVVPEYIGYAIQSNAFVDMVVANSNGIAYPAITETVLGRLPVVMPPIDEQHAICQWVAEQCRPLDAAIASIEKEIALVLEYRQRQILDAVTGQIDLRSWQPGSEDAATEDELAALTGGCESETNEEDDDDEEN